MLTRHPCSLCNPATPHNCYHCDHGPIRQAAYRPPPPAPANPPTCDACRHHAPLRLQSHFPPHMAEHLAYYVTCKTLAPGFSLIMHIRDARGCPAYFPHAATRDLEPTRETPDIGGQRVPCRTPSTPEAATEPTQP